jgi:cytochrome c peroxidase
MLQQQTWELGTAFPKRGWELFPSSLIPQSTYARQYALKSREMMNTNGLFLQQATYTILLCVTATFATGNVQAQTGLDTPTLETLSGVVVPDPSGTEGDRSVSLADYVVDRPMAIRLGKALFWDMNLGSDGSTACASCHFHAGADNRTKNQLAPPLVHTDPRVAALFTKPAQSPSWGPNHALTASDFPTHVLANILDRDSPIVSSTADIVGSQGVYETAFTKPGQSRFDDCTLQSDNTFQVGGINTRRVTPRNSPTVINAALNVRNFWDGRANNTFNGFSPFGRRDPDGGIWVTTSTGGAATKVALALKDASAASQAVGPPGSNIEMSCGGRTFPNIARRVLDLPALNRQSIDANDSVLRDFPGGLKPKYRQLIQAAFQARLWNASQQVSLGGVPYSQIEANFPLFFGLAIQLYESTLISDQTPLDSYLKGNSTALNQQQIRGMQTFIGKGMCINCHNGPELTAAATRLRLSPKEPVENMVMGDGQVAIYDNGFYNIGVRPTAEDLGVGGTDPWGNPLSFTRQYRTIIAGNSVPDQFLVDPCKFAVPLPTATCDPISTKPDTSFRDAVDGAFKTPTLRNIALTGPYFHNGSHATLEQVVAFYNRGGNRRGSDVTNTSGFGSNRSNLDPDIQPLGLNDQEQADLVAFLRDGLTDPRVVWERAPFDHPSLDLNHGHIGDTTRVPGPNQPSAPKRAPDILEKLPSIGSAGRSVKQGPLQPFYTGLK